MSDNGQTALATMESGALPAKQDLAARPRNTVGECLGV